MLKRLLCRILGYRLLLGAVGFCLWSCAAPQPEIEAPSSTPGSVVPETASHQPPVTPIASTEEVLKRLESERLISEQEKRTLAEEYYQTGLKFYKELRLQEAKDNLTKARAIRPDHQKAQELLDEVRLALGEYVHGEMGAVSRKLINEILVKIQQAQIEIQNHLNQGITAYQEGDYGKAEEEFRWVIESVQWFPYQTELAIYQKQAEDYLEKTIARKRKKEIEIKRRQEEEARQLSELEEKKRQKDFRRTMEMLFNQAQTEFQRARYKETERLCRKILEKDPTNIMAQKLRVIALVAARAKLRKQTTQTMAEEWKRTFELFNFKTIPQSLPLVLPDKETWEKIERRGPKSIFKEKPISELDQQASLMLERRLTFPYKAPVPLSEIVQFIRETIRDINMLIDTTQVDPQEQIAYSAIEVPLKDALTDMLTSKNWSYMVKESVIIITTQEKVIEDQIETRWYDILDLTIPVIDFPGPEIGLSATMAPPEESLPMPRIQGDQLSELIRETIAKVEGWDPPFDIAFQESTGVLVVNHLPNVHKDIERLLKSIRAAMDMVVTIEARFLTVQKHFLEDIGIDMRGLLGYDLPREWSFARPPEGPGFTGDRSDPAYLEIDTNDDGMPDQPDPDTYEVASTGVFRRSSTGGHELRARVEHIVGQDVLLSRFFTNVIANTGASTLNYYIAGDKMVNIIMTAIKKDAHAKVLVAPKITIFNGQRAHLYISQQYTYIKDFDIVQASGVQGSSAADPVTDIVMDGIVLDARPTISADLKYISLELRPTFALLDPPPPNLNTIWVDLKVQIPDQGIVEIELPDMRLQRARMNAVIPDGGTILLGGYSMGQEISYASEVPILSKIPLMGMLFRRKTDLRQERVLLILVSAKISILSEEEKLKY